MRELGYLIQLPVLFIKSKEKENLGFFYKNKIEVCAILIIVFNENVSC